MERHSEHLQFQKSLFGIVAAAVANFSYSRPKEPLEPADFVGGKRMRDRVAKKQQVANLRAFLMSHVKNK